MAQFHPYETLAWEEFLRRFQWEQGDHVMATAPTKAGKTTLLRAILPRRKFQIVLATKGTDESLNKFLRAGYTRRESWEDVKWHDEKVLLWPHHRKTVPDTFAYQSAIFKRALNEIYQQGSWTVVADEYHYCCEFLGLAKYFALYQHQGRSAGLTVVAGFQRPAWVPRVTYSGSTHAFIWKTTDTDDAKRLKDLGGIDAKELGLNALRLRPHQFVYVHTRDHSMPVISQVQL